MIYEVGIALAQRCNGAVLGVALAAFEPLQDQHAVAFVLADAFADGLQRFAQGTSGFALAFTGVDLDALHAQLAGPLVEMGPHFRVQIGKVDQGAWSSAAGGNHLKARWLGRQGAHHVFFIEQPQVEQGVELIEHHHRIEGTGEGPFGDIPAPLRFLAVKTGDFIGSEEVGAASSDLVDEMGETLLQRLNGGVFGVGPAWPFEKAQQQNAGALFLADAQSDGAQHHAKSGLAFAFALTVVDVQLTAQALVATGCCANADAPAGGCCHSALCR